MKLKTLNEIMNDIRFTDYEGKKAEGYDFYKIQSKLRQEAIEWIKEMDKIESDIEESRVDDDVIDWIKHFFNITEEDLK